VCVGVCLGVFDAGPPWYNLFTGCRCTVSLFGPYPLFSCAYAVVRSRSPFTILRRLAHTWLCLKDGIALHGQDPVSLSALLAICVRR